MLELWEKIGFEKSRTPFPPEILAEWHSIEKRHLLAQGQASNSLKSQIQSAGRRYQEWLSGFASKTLENYLQAIVDHILPLMQNADHITRVTQERIEDAIRDGIIGLELRFAPQLCIEESLSLHEVLEAVLRGLEESPIPVQLNLCVLRHENEEMACKLADLVIAYDDRVSTFDLAGDESKYPGIPHWWLQHAQRVQDAGKKVSIHLWEVNEPTEEDVRLLDEYHIFRISHGIRGHSQGTRILEITPTSNLVTGQVASYNQHPIHRLYSEGKRVTVNTDGTLFTRINLTEEYLRLHQTFGWGKKEFLDANLNALEATHFPESIKRSLKGILDLAYNDTQ
jgi:adenosine deaminase